MHMKHVLFTQGSCITRMYMVAMRTSKHDLEWFIHFGRVSTFQTPLSHQNETVCGEISLVPQNKASCGKPNGINLPFGDRLYNPWIILKILILGMVYGQGYPGLTTLTSFRNFFGGSQAINAMWDPIMANPENHPSQIWFSKWIWLDQWLYRPQHWMHQKNWTPVNYEVNTICLLGLS